MCDRPADDPSAPSPHRHCDACGLPFAIAKLSLVALLDVLRFRELVLDDGCVDELRAAGAIVDFIRELDVQEVAA